MISRRQFSGCLLTLATAAVLEKPGELYGLDPSAQFQALPPDLPLPALPKAKATWTHDARVLQPWGKTQYLALTNLGDRPERLKEKFGFNVLMVMPTPAHNAITPSNYHLTEEQFQEALAAFRHAGYKLMLYSSIMHCGHAPQWQFGKIEREHPDWSQVDAAGNRVTDYGHAWVCPNSPGLEYTLHYTQGLVKKYHPDAIMIDDNGFYHTREGGWSCYCRYCRKGFQDYVLRRCGAGWLQSQLGLKPDAINIPAKSGPLYALWLHYRNRVWARADEAFRQGLRRVDPSIVLFANTLYDYPTAEQSSDLQYDHEDVVFSESHHSDSWYMSEKMLYGKAIAAGKRPLWNYVATFEDSDFSVMRPPDVSLPMLASSLAHGGLPWIVYRGFHQSFNKPTLDGMSLLMAWYAAHRDFFRGERWAPVAALVSTESRNALNQPLLPAHVLFLLQHGVPLALLRAEHVSPATLKPYSVVTAETCEIMSQTAVGALADWTRAGGKLIAHADVAAFGPMGRKLPRSLLWQSLGFRTVPQHPSRAGRGQVLLAEQAQVSRMEAGGQAAAPPFGRLALRQVRDVAFGLPPLVAEVVPYRQQRRVLLHLIQHMAHDGSLGITVPAPLCSQVKVTRWHRPGHEEPQRLPVSRDGPGLKITVPHLLPYSVIELEK